MIINRIKIFSIFYFLIVSVAIANQKIFVGKQFVHLHKNPSVNSLVLLTLSCGQEVNITSTNNEWLEISTGSYNGFVLKRNFVMDTPECFSQKHSKLYNKLDISMRDIYKLGRLEDLFIIGEPKL